MLNSFQHLTASLYLAPSLGEILKQVNFVQFAYARHSSSKLGSALAQSQISASHCEAFLVFLRSQILKRVQDDFGRFLLFILSFWGSQFNTYVKSHRSQLIAHNSKICRICVICVSFTIFVKKQEKGILG